MRAGGDRVGRIVEALTRKQMRGREPWVVAAGVHVLSEGKRKVSGIPGSGPKHLGE